MLDSVDVTSICRNEWCDREEIHLAHEEDFSRKRVLDKRPRSVRAPWLLAAPIALDDSIVRNVSDTTPKRFASLVNDVENDFGSLGESKSNGLRRLHRRLKSLVDAGRLLRIDLGDTLYAYLKPTSRIASDITFIRETIQDGMYEDNGRRAEVG